MWIIICCPLDLENYSDNATFRRDASQMFLLVDVSWRSVDHLIDSRFTFLKIFVYKRTILRSVLTFNIFSLWFEISSFTIANLFFHVK